MREVVLGGIGLALICLGGWFGTLKKPKKKRPVEFYDPVEDFMRRH